MALAHFRIVTAVERNQALSLARAAILASGGWVTGHSLFSNVAATINFELPGTALDGLVARLVADGLNPSRDDTGTAATSGDVRAVLSLTFLHREPDFHRDVPPFG